MLRSIVSWWSLSVLQILLHRVQVSYRFIAVPWSFSFVPEDREHGPVGFGFKLS